MSASGTGQNADGKDTQTILGADGEAQFVVLPADEYELLMQTVAAARKLIGVRATIDEKMVDRLGGKDRACLAREPRPQSCRTCPRGWH